MNSRLKTLSYALLALLPLQSSIAAAQLAPTCDKMKFKAYPAVNIGPGVGTVYIDKSGTFSPSTNKIACTGVFEGKPNQNKIKTTVFTGTETAEKKKAGSLALGLLELIFGGSGKGSASASIARGDKWEMKTAPFEIRGENALTALTFFAKDDDCLKQIKAALTGKASINVFVIMQVAQTDEINYKRTTSSSTDIGAEANLDKVATLKAGYKVEKTSENSLSVSGGPFNVCYAPPIKKKLKASPKVGPREFTIF